MDQGGIEKNEIEDYEKAKRNVEEIRRGSSDAQRSRDVRSTRSLDKIVNIHGSMTCVLPSAGFRPEAISPREGK